MKSLEEAQTELMRLADHDALTGLATRRFLDERLIHGLARAARTNESLAALALGIDVLNTQLKTDMIMPRATKCCALSRQDPLDWFESEIRRRDLRMTNAYC